MALSDADRLQMIAIALMKHSTVTAGGWPPPALTPPEYGGTQPFTIAPVFVPGYAQDKLFLIITQRGENTFAELKAGETISFQSGSLRIMAFYIWNGALSRAFVGKYESGISFFDVINLLRAWLPTVQRTNTVLTDTYSIYIPTPRNIIFADIINLEELFIPTMQYTNLMLTDTWSWAVGS